MPVTIDNMTAEVEAPSERHTSSNEQPEKADGVKPEIVRAVVARLALRALRVRAD